MASPLRRRTLDDTARVALIERGILVLVIGGLFIGVSATVKPLITPIPFGAALAAGRGVAKAVTGHPCSRDYEAAA